MPDVTMLCTLFILMYEMEHQNLANMTVAAYFEFDRFKNTPNYVGKRAVFFK